MNVCAINKMYFFFQLEPICAVGHGVAGLCSAKREDGKSWSFKSFSMTGVTKLLLNGHYLVTHAEVYFCF